MQIKQKTLTRSQEKNRQALEIIIKGFAFLIVVAVVGFAEIMFLQMLSKMFPANPLMQTVSMIGATATGLSVLVLLLAKLWWIRAGVQHWVSWIFFLIEITVMAMNLILSFMLLHTTPQNLDTWMLAYYNIMPATVVIPATFWCFIFYTDHAKEKFDAQRDLADELEESEMEHTRIQHSTLMDVRRRINDIHAAQVIEEVQQRTPDIQRMTSELVAREVEGMLGMYVPRSTNYVEGSVVKPKGLPAPATFAQTANIEVPATGEKKGIVQKIKDTISNANDNLPHIKEEVVQSSTAEPAPALQGEVQGKTPRPFHANTEREVQQQKTQARRNRRNRKNNRT